MTAFVLDSSLTLAWYFRDDAAPYATAVRESLEHASAWVPALWSLEISNALVVGERRQRSTEAQAVAWLALLARLPIERDDQTASRAWSDTLALARAQRLSAYDAAYLELALRRNLPLASLDEQLTAAAAKLGVKRYRRGDSTSR